MLCTVLSFDPYGALMGVGATALLIAATCSHISVAGFVVAGIMAWAAALMSALNLVSIALTSVCDGNHDYNDYTGIDISPSPSPSPSLSWDDDDDLNGMNSTNYTGNYNTPNKNATATNASDDSSIPSFDDTDEGEYTFFCTYQHFFLILTILSTILWMTAGKYTLDMSYQQASRNSNNDHWNDSGEETVAMEEDEQDDDFTESCIMEQGEVNNDNNNQDTAENDYNDSIDGDDGNDDINDTRNFDAPSSHR